MEKRPSVSEKELTPIVVNQLQTTKRQKDDARKLRRGSHPKAEGNNSVVEAVTVEALPGHVSDSGAESCGEDRMKTAEEFITGISSALDEAEVGEKSDLIDEVESVLGKLLSTLQKEDSSSSGLTGHNTIALITSLQATLKANVVPGRPPPQTGPPPNQTSQKIPQPQPLVALLQQTTKSGASSQEQSPPQRGSGPPPGKFPPDVPETQTNNGKSSGKPNLSLQILEPQTPSFRSPEGTTPTSIPFSPSAATTPKSFDTTTPKSSDATTPNSRILNKEWKNDPLGSLPKRPRAQDVKQDFDEPIQAKTFDPTKNRQGSRLSGEEEKIRGIAPPDTREVLEVKKVEEAAGHTPKIPWKIRASRKRQQKHLTLGLTREEFANIQETLKNRPVEFTGFHPAPYALMRNQSDGAILSKNATFSENFPAPAASSSLYNPPPLPDQESPDELGYVSDVCDYTVKPQPKEEGGVLMGTLSLSLVPDKKILKIDKSTKVFQKDDSYLHSQVKISPLSPSVSESSKMDVSPAASICSQEPQSKYIVKNSLPTQTDTDTDINTFNIVKPFKDRTDDEAEDSQLSRQSSVDDSTMESKRGRRSSSSRKTSTIKSKIHRRKMLREANMMDNPGSALSGDDQENDQDSVEEKQDSESIHDDENFYSKKTNSGNKFAPPATNVNMSELTPETARRMKNWNSRFSNLKSSFDANLDNEEGDKSRSPSMQRLEVTELDGRGRSRFKDKGHDGPRSKSAHVVRSPRVSTTSQPETVFESASRTPENQRAPSKEDKNKNNALIASTADSNKEDDEYLQYLNSVDKYRQNNLKPMPIRPVTSRTDAIANPARKTDGPIRQQSVGTTPSKRLQITPVRENNGLVARTSQSVPKETRTELRVKEESQAEILGLVRTNRETGKVEQTKDMDYEDYMNIINKVRKTKESTRVRTEQIRLSSMYAQERKRQQEIQLEEERLKREYQDIEEESKNPLPIITTVASLMTSNSNENLEKGQIDNNEKEQYMKVSPKISPSPIQSSKSEPSVPQWENLARQQQIIEKSRLEQSKNEQTKKENEEARMKKIETERMAHAKEEQKRLLEEERKMKEAMKQEELKAFNEKQRQEQQAKEKQKRIEEQQQQEKIQEQARQEQIMIEQIQNEQIRQQKLREEQVQAEQKKLEELKEVQITKEKEREEIRRLEFERLQQIREDQKLLEVERHKQQERIRQEQARIEVERRKHEQLQKERQELYSKQQEEMEANVGEQAGQMELEVDYLKVDHIRHNSLSPNERLIVEKLRHQELLREEQLKEEASIRKEKLKLIHQEEELLTRQDEMLHQIREEKMNLAKQEELIRSRQQGRLQQVRAEKALLEKQEQMLKIREEQLLQERKRQERLRDEATSLRKQEESIKRRQEEIAKELLKGDNISVDDVMVCQAREGQVFVGPKPYYPETMLDSNIVHVQPLTSDWSSSDAESLMNTKTTNTNTDTTQSFKPQHSYMGASTNFDESPFKSPEEEIVPLEEQWSGSSEEEDTLDDDECYECKVEVKQQNTSVPTSVRTIEMVVNVPGWAPITPYLNVSTSVSTTQEEVHTIFSEAKTSGMQYKTAGVITSPDSIASTHQITTPDSSMSLQSQISMNDGEFSFEASSWPNSPIDLPPVPPPPKESKDLMPEPFQTVQPDVPPRDDSYAIAAVYGNGGSSPPKQQIDVASQRRSLIEDLPRSGNNDFQLSHRIGGPGSAFKPYASNENLYDPGLFPRNAVDPNGQKSLATHSGQQNNGDRHSKRYSNSNMKPPKISESEEEYFRPRPRPQQQSKASKVCTTDTEPEMREFNLAPMGGDKKTKKQQKPIYSTSETEEEYQAYMKSKPKWHGKGGHKDSWDPLQIASPPQIVQRPVGVVQKPKPQAKIAQKVERQAQVYPVSLQIYPGVSLAEQIRQEPNPPIGLQNSQSQMSVGDSSSNANNGNGLVPPNFERIQKSGSIIELREKQGLIPSTERIQKSSSVVEVKPVVVPKPTIAENTIAENNSMQERPYQTSAFSRPAPSQKEITSEKNRKTSENLINENFAMTQSSQANHLLNVNNTSNIRQSSIVASPPQLQLESVQNSGSLQVQSTGSLQVPLSPNDSEDQTTPKAPRKFYNMTKQTSIESTNSFSENDELCENQAPQIRSTKEDPETTKKKEIHKNLMSEALKKVELRTNKQKQFNQLNRTNPTIAAIGLMTRKELKMEEMEKDQEEKRSRNASGNDQVIPFPSEPPKYLNGTGTTADPAVLKTFKEQSIYKAQTMQKRTDSQNSASRMALMQAKKAGTPIKPDTMPKPTEARRSSRDIAPLQEPPNTETPVVILKKQPRRLEPEELKARKSSIERQKPEILSGKPGSRNSTSNGEVRSPSTNLVTNSGNVSTHDKSAGQANEGSGMPNVQGQRVTASTPSKISNTAEDQVKAANTQQIKRAPQPAIPTPQESRKPTVKATPSVSSKEEITAKAIEKINAVQLAQQKQKINPKTVPAKNLPDIVNVTPKQTNVQPQTVVEKKQIVKNTKNLKEKKVTETDDKGAVVKKAAEKFESSLSDLNKSDSETSNVGFSTYNRGRAKSFGTALLEQFEEDQDSGKNAPKTNLPWAGKSPPVIKRKDMIRTRNYALQMSKSSDSITAAKLLAKAREENQGMGMGGLRINQPLTKSIERQIDIYSKTKEDIRNILMMAKSGSVTDRVKMFTTLIHKDQDAPEVNPEEKADAIRREIEEARAQAQETVSDTEIDFQEPIESKVKPLKLTMKPKISNKPQKSKSCLRINQFDHENSPKRGLRINHTEDSPKRSGLRINRNDSPKEDRERHSSIEDFPSVKSKIQNYLTAAEDLNKEDDSKEESMPKPILVKKNQIVPVSQQEGISYQDKAEARRERGKKSPKLLSDHYLSAGQTLEIYAQSATDLSADENEAELRNSRKSKKSPEKKTGPRTLSTKDPGPNFLQIPINTEQKSPGLMKSKSFASPGQFEGSLDDPSITSKKETMMAFFNANITQASPQSPTRMRSKLARSNSVTSITDEILDEEDYQNVDAEFESLLNSTFESETTRRVTTAGVSKQSGFVGSFREKAGLRARGQGNSSVVTGAGGRKLHDKSANRKISEPILGSANMKAQQIQKSPSFGSNFGARSRSCSEDRVTPTDGPYQNSPLLKQKNFDPLAALPTSHTKKYLPKQLSLRTGTPPAQYSPSPTQSEYDTCDDDYVDY